MTDISGITEGKTAQRLYYDSVPILQTSKFIRVLDVQAAADDEAPLSGSLRSINLADNPSFSALSYVWGEDKDGRVVLCDHVQVPITANGYSALQHLRRKLGSFTIWIDAICIDQNNESEKESQIPLMGEIYHFAEPVYVWLGEGDQQSNRAMELLGRTGILECFLSDIEAQTPRDRPQLWRAIWRFGRPQNLPFMHDMLYPTWRPIFRHSRKRRLESKCASQSDMRYLLDRSWISRVWTFQEIVLARRPIVVCGDRHLSWAPFSWNILILYHFAKITWLKDWKGVVEACSHYFDLSLTNKGSCGDMKSKQSRLEAQEEMIASLDRSLKVMMRWVLTTCLIHFSCLIPAIVLLVLSTSTVAGSSTDEFPVRSNQYMYTGVGSGCLLLWILSAPIVWKATRGHDNYIQARVARGNPDPTAQWINVIISKKSKMPQDKAYGVQAITQNLIKHRLPDPDYDLPIEHIYRDLCATMLAATGSLQFLLPAATNHLRGAPSWVPDFRAAQAEYWANVAGIRGMQRAIWRPISNDPNTLQLQGHQLGIVKSTFIFKSVPDTFDDSEACKVHAENLRTLLKLAKAEKVERGTNDVDGYFMDLKVRIFAPQRWRDVMKIWQGQDPERLYRRWRSSCDWKSGICITRSHLVDPRCWWNILSWLRGGSNPFSMTEAFCKLLAAEDRYLMLFADETGLENLVVCTGDVKPGDRVIYLHGGPCPFVVRDEDDGTRLISPVHSSRVSTCNPIPTKDALSRMPEVDIKLI